VSRCADEDLAGLRRLVEQRRRIIRIRRRAIDPLRQQRVLLSRERVMRSARNSLVGNAAEPRVAHPSFVPISLGGDTPFPKLLISLKNLGAPLSSKKRTVG
jgi:hypothetical protein